MGGHRNLDLKPNVLTVKHGGGSITMRDCFVEGFNEIMATSQGREAKMLKIKADLIESGSVLMKISSKSD